MSIYLLPTACELMKYDALIVNVMIFGYDIADIIKKKKKTAYNADSGIYRQRWLKIVYW